MNTLTDKQYKKLAELGELIILDLSENMNGDGVPGKTCRLSAVDNMKQYLELHDYEVK